MIFVDCAFKPFGILTKSENKSAVYCSISADNALVFAIRSFSFYICSKLYEGTLVKYAGELGISRTALCNILIHNLNTYPIYI